MYKYDLKNNPELAKERHRQQNREWYQKHKEQKMAYQKEYRAKKKEEKEKHEYYIRCADAFRAAWIKQMHEEAKTMQMLHEALMKELEKEEALKRQKRAEYQREYRKRKKQCGK